MTVQQVPAWTRIVAVMVDSGLMREHDDPANVGGSAHWLAVGERLRHSAQDLNDRLHAAPGSNPTADRKQTICHGDPKASNFFFNPTAETSDGGGGGKGDGSVDGADPASGTGAVGFIDFQWSGEGEQCTLIPREVCRTI